MRIEKEIRDFLRAYYIKLITSQRSFSIGKLFSCKDHQPLLHSSSVGYQLTRSLVKIILGKPNVTSFLASMNIEL